MFQNGQPYWIAGFSDSIGERHRCKLSTEIQGVRSKSAFWGFRGSAADSDGSADTIEKYGKDVVSVSRTGTIPSRIAEFPAIPETRGADTFMAINPNDPKNPAPVPPATTPADTGVEADVPELDLSDFENAAPPGPLPEEAPAEIPELVAPLSDVLLADTELVPPLSDVIDEAEFALPLSEVLYDSVSFDDLPSPLDADPASMTIGVSFDDLPGWAELPEALPLTSDLTVPEADPASFATAVPTNAGNLEPIAPVAPASGWLDADAPPVRLNPDAALFDEPMDVDVDAADPFGTPTHTLESSDIFAGPALHARTVDQSDVIAATAYGKATPADFEKPTRPSEVAMSFDHPPGGSTIQEPGANSDLPVAEEMASGSDDIFAPVEDISPDAGDIFGQTEAMSPDSDNIFDSAKLADAALPDLPNSKRQPTPEAPDFGASPMFTPDASSILADLTELSSYHTGDTSGVRIEAPGMGRTFSSHLEDGTEFDLTVSDELIPPELAEAEAEASGTELADWPMQASSDLFDDTRTAAELDLDDGLVSPVDINLEPDQPSFTSAPSSIFSSGKIPGGGSKIGKSDVPLGIMPGVDEEGSSVEFSDHPSAEDEASASRIFRGPRSPAIPSGSPKPASGSSRGRSISDDPDEGKIDWAEPSDDDIDLSQPASSGIGQPDPLASGIFTIDAKGRRDDQATMPSRRLPASPSSKAPVPPPEEDPSVEIDWLAGSSSEEPILADAAVHSAEDVAVAEDVPERELDFDAPTREADKLKGKGKGTDKEKSKEKSKTSPAKPAKAAPVKEKAAKQKAEPSTNEPRRGKGGWVGGTLVGMVIAGGAFAGVYFGGVIPNAEQKTAQLLPQGQPGQNPPNTNPGVTNPATPTAADIAAAIRAGDAAKAKEIAAAIKDTTPLGKAREGEAGLFALVQEKGTMPITADNADLKAARENLQVLVDDPEAAATPASEKTAVKAAIQLGLTHELAGDRAAAKQVYETAKVKFKKYASTFDAALFRLADTAPAAMPDGNSRRLAPADARQLLLAITLLQADPAKDKEVDPEAGVYFWKAINLATGAKYAEAIREIDKAKAAHIKQAKAAAGTGLNPLSDPLEQMFPRCCDDLKAHWELRAAIYANKSVADLIKKDGAEKAMTELAAAVKKASELKEATDKLTVVVKDLKDAKDLVTKLEKDVKEADDAKVTVEKKLDAEEKARLKADETIAAIAKELQTAKFLGDKFDNAELLAAQKKIADRASGPTLSTLLPPGMMAIGGAGLSAAQLLDTADRLTKAETTAKTANEKLAAETKRLTGEQAEALKKLGEAHTVEVKKMTDAFATDTTKLKEDQTTELKKLADKFAVDAKKITDDFSGKVKDLEAAVATEKKQADAADAKFKQDLGNAVSPAQALDIWLPLLVELRRPSDADAALAIANKVIATAPADSDEAGKARTVAGLALLLKGDLATAKTMFQTAKANPTHKAALEAKKLWAVAANVGLESVSDPLAPFRQPAELPKRDPAAAARLFDAGVSAYKAGRYADAIGVLTDSTKADATNPLTWYFLGAAKWASGAIDQARDDFRQGAVREKDSTLSTRSISASLAPIQGTVRDALTATRP